MSRMSFEQAVRMQNVIYEVQSERLRQHEMRGEQNLDRQILWDTDLGELLRECRSAQEIHPTWDDVLIEEALEAVMERDPVKLRAELVQVAATAVQWVEAIDREAAR